MLPKDKLIFTLSKIVFLSAQVADNILITKIIFRLDLTIRSLPIKPVPPNIKHFFLPSSMLLLTSLFSLKSQLLS